MTHPWERTLARGLEAKPFDATSIEVLGFCRLYTSLAEEVVIEV
jgi:hypothetical protein